MLIQQKMKTNDLMVLVGKSSQNQTSEASLCEHAMGE
jgi:hypothetical protein